MAQLYSSNFEAETLAATPSGWTLAFGYGEVVTNNPVSGTRAFSLNGGTYALYGTPQTVQRAQFSQKGVWADIGLLMRSDSTGDNAYRWVVNGAYGSSNGYVAFQKGVAGAWTNLAQFFNLVVGAAGLVVEAVSDGTTHELRFWEVGSSRPVAPTCTYTDTDAPHVSGVVGVYNNSSQKRELDDFSYYSDTGVIAASLPGAPTNVVATAGNGSASVSFTAPASNGGAAITGYKVTASTGQTATGSASPITVTGLSAVATTFTVQAINSAGTGPASAASNSVTPTTDTIKPVLQTAAVNAEGSAVVLTYDEPLQTSAPATSAFVVGNHSITGVTIADRTVILAVNPMIDMSEVLEMGYTKPATNPIQDAAGNQADSFTNQSVTNNVAPYTWKFLGYEGTQATVPANTVVRYGANGSFVTKTLSGNFYISNGTFGSDPASGTTKYAEAYLAIPQATAFIVTMGNSGPVGTSPAFTVEANGFLTEAKTITFSGTGLTFSPPSITLGPDRSGYAKATFTISTTAPVVTTVQFATTSNLTVPAAKSYSAAYEIIKTIGAGKDFADLAAFANHVMNMDVPALGTHVVGEAYSNLNGNGVTLRPANSSGAAHIILRPAAAYRSKAVGAKGYGTGSLIITGGITGNFDVQTGVEIVDFDINLPNDSNSLGRNYFGSLATGSQNWGTGGTYAPRFTNCRIRCANPNRSLFLGGYGVHTYFDNCQIIQEEIDNTLFDGATVYLNGCALVRRNGTFAKPLIGNVGTTIMENCWGVGLGNQLSVNIDQQWAYFRNNVLDTAITVGKDRDYRDLAPVGYTVASNFVTNVVSDLTPTAGSVLLGGANYRAQSTEDMLGNNRGLSPDIGPVQRTPATPLVVARVTSPTIPDGESLTLSGTTTNTPTSALITLVPADPANGAIRQGPFPITLGTGTFTVTVDDIVSGDYLAPVLTFTNSGGTSQATGATPFTLMGTDAYLMTVSTSTTTPGNPGNDTPPPAPAPTVTLTTASDQIMSGKTATVSGAVNLQGDSSGTVTVFADPQPSGAAINLGAAFVSNGVWTKQATLTKGQWRLRVVAAANNQTVQAISGTVRVLGLVGNFTLPGP